MSRLTRDYLDGFANGHRRLVHLILAPDILHPDG
jgi:hypothetical protein